MGLSLEYWLYCYVSMYVLYNVIGCYSVDLGELNLVDLCRNHSNLKRTNRVAAILPQGMLSEQGTFCGRQKFHRFATNSSLEMKQLSLLLQTTTIVTSQLVCLSILVEIIRFLCTFLVAHHFKVG